MISEISMGFLLIANARGTEPHEDASLGRMEFFFPRSAPSFLVMGFDEDHCAVLARYRPRSILTNRNTRPYSVRVSAAQSTFSIKSTLECERTAGEKVNNRVNLTQPKTCVDEVKAEVFAEFVKRTLRVVEFVRLEIFPRVTLQDLWACIFEWDWHEEPRTYCLVHGLGSLYNHSFAPNADYCRDYANLTINFTALRDIRAGEEV
ncbi:hypothetical protein PAPYR_10232 [Paratrimastix pyriformis]|uniref:SET domain-containing protein n=1 Tax=Paratrimastix pyriformis TaxID=342808 RepID=A0ABQ8UA90_9EUKA|nr:hypothetical protein PAPYR_10232 [Paratrimastix pyriformis]